MAAGFVLVSALLAVQGASAHLFSGSIPRTYANITACLDEPISYSCENTTVIQNTCCSPTPGGLVLQAQFWDTYTGFEKEGQLLPKDSWTIHGLWPDNCDGTYEQYCDLSRQYDPAPDPSVLPDGTVVPAYTGPGIDTFVTEFGRVDLLDYMKKYWVSQGALNSAFWGHEFSKHATCTSTFDVACYGPDYKKNQDVVDFFDAVVRAFKLFPSYQILAAAGITPSNKTTYPLSRIEAALKAQTGALPHIGCGGPNGTVLQELWYYNHVSGTEQYGNFKPLDTTFGTTCSSTEGIWYYERTPTSEREVRNLP